MPVIAVNDAVRFAPWADVLYACDAKWWDHHPESYAFEGLKYSLRRVGNRPDVQVLQQGGDRGLSLDPTTLHTGKNSGYQAINLAVHLGASRILLVGYDMQLGVSGEVHFFGRHSWHRDDPPFGLFLSHFDSLVEPLKAIDVEVINCTRRTALHAFPIKTLEDALADVEVPA